MLGDKKKKQRYDSGMDVDDMGGFSGAGGKINYFFSC